MNSSPYDPPPKVVEKKPPANARQWVEDVLTQAEMARKQGLTSPLKVGIAETAHLTTLLEVAEAAEELCAHHGDDMAPFARERFARLQSALNRYRK